MATEDGELIRIETRGGLLILTVSADQLTAFQATDDFDERIRELLDQRHEKRWIIDFRSVTFMVTPAVNTIMTAHRRLAQAGGALVITGLSDNIRRIFSLMRLDEVLSIAASVESALQLFQA